MGGTSDLAGEVKRTLREPSSSLPQGLPLLSGRALPVAGGGLLTEGGSQKHRTFRLLPTEGSSAAAGGALR